MIRVGLLGLSRREGTFSEVGLRSWEEAGCAAVERVLQSAESNVFAVHRPLVIRSSRAEAEKILRDWCDAPNKASRCELILTVGGTGLTSADILPEVVFSLVQRPMPGISELLRRIGYDIGYAPAFLSRGVAGTRGNILLINLPGDAKGFADEASLTAMMQALLPHLAALVSTAQE